ncbi:conserved hypothetical protein [Ricinus communis]|uniref:Uncharacterized protein n=1 Tax=Ricinus communis TaxID=3988 RepID=B9SGR0_RICCO|nr:conserved hypothetical protein [Ricinus communis]
MDIPPSMFDFEKSNHEKEKAPKQEGKGYIYMNIIFKIEQIGKGPSLLDELFKKGVTGAARRFARKATEERNAAQLQLQQTTSPVPPMFVLFDPGNPSMYPWMLKNQT